MKRLILLIFVCFAAFAKAQTNGVDTAIKFDHVITAYEKHWVVLKKPDTALYYTFGYVYIQSDKGFMFKEAGQFEIDQKNQYILRAGKKDKYVFSADNADQFAPARVIRLRDTIGGMNSKQIRLPQAAVLPSKHFKELKIEDEPKWIKPYYTYSDTLEHNYRWGCYHNEETDFTVGIIYWEKVYKISPHYKGVKVPMDNAAWINHQGIEMKLGSAYNSTKQYDKAIVLFKDAIRNDPTNLGFYFELGATYRGKADWLGAIDVYKRGLDQIKVDKSEFKSWMAGFISNAYTDLKNDEESKKWRAKSLEYSPCPSCVY
ncbi:tetratricopeptide repeat protein [Mucilaginibacter sp. UYCu711]|uniref:tetratricopeptide repeat protein n=1 Tax=Mucilaginibacter sp. UYCu711 TaxID=3156339 RepID=UPI003D1CD60D